MSWVAMALMGCILGACASHEPIDVRSEADASAGTTDILRMRIDGQREEGATAGRLGCIERFGGQSWVLEAVAADLGDRSPDVAEFRVRKLEDLPLPLEADASWYEAGDVLLLSSVSRSNAAGYFNRLGQLVRVVGEDSKHALCLLLGSPEDTRPAVPGTPLWTCQPEVAGLLAEMHLPPDPYLARDVGAPFGRLAAVEGRFALVDKQAVSVEDLVEISWMVSGDARVSWSGCSRVTQSAWSAMADREIGPFMPEALRDSVVLSCGVAAYRAALKPRTYGELVIRHGDERLVEGRLDPQYGFAVACQLRNALLAAKKERPEAQQFDCEIEVVEISFR